MCFIFDKLSYFFSMVNVAIIQNENASRPRVGICEGNLVFMLDFKHNKCKNKCTTSLQRNCTKCSKFTDPGMISYAMIPSNVRIGRIENRCPWIKCRLCTHLLPTNDHPLVRAEAFLLRTASSVKMSISGLGTWSANSIHECRAHEVIPFQCTSRDMFVRVV